MTYLDTLFLTPRLTKFHVLCILYVSQVLFFHCYMSAKLFCPRWHWLWLILVSFCLGSWHILIHYCWHCGSPTFIDLGEPMRPNALVQVIWASRYAQMVWNKWFGWADAPKCFGTSGLGESVRPNALVQVVWASRCARMTWYKWFGQVDAPKCFGTSGLGESVRPNALVRVIWASRCVQMLWYKWSGRVGAPKCFGIIGLGESMRPKALAQVVWASRCAQMLCYKSFFDET